jgi:hypothetical protein
MSTLTSLAPAAALPQPPLTDHAFATPHGQLLRALRPFLRRTSLPLLGAAQHLARPLTAQVLMPGQVGISLDGRRVSLPIGTQLLATSIAPTTGYTRVVATEPASTRPLFVSADVLQASYDEEGASLLEQVLTRLPIC